MSEQDDARRHLSALVDDTPMDPDARLNAVHRGAARIRTRRRAAGVGVGVTVPLVLLLGVLVVSRSGEPAAPDGTMGAAPNSSRTQDSTGDFIADGLARNQLSQASGR